MPKSSQAFRTISEVAEELDIQKHVLRFWESKFTQLKPMKRGGGRRYYRPEDVELLRGIHHLLRSQAYTIKGVQRILREQGVDFVKDCWQGKRGMAAPAEQSGTATAGRKRAAVSAAPAASARPAAKGRGAAAAHANRLATPDAKTIKSAVEQLEVARAALAKTRAATPKAKAEPIKPAAPRRKTTARRS